MRHDEDFSAYVVARWPSLVRSLVLLGCGAHEAEDIAQSALERCYLAWERVRHADDVDAYVFRTVLNVWAKSRSRRWWGERPTEVLPDPPRTTPDALAEDVALRVVLERILADLTPEQRSVLVLRFVADLTEQQTADVLGVALGTVKSRVSRALAEVDVTALQEEIR